MQSMTIRILPLFAFIPTWAQQSEPVVSKDSLSVHRIERGDMPILAAANGSLVSLDPPKATLQFAGDAARCEARRGAKVVFPPAGKPFAAKILGAGGGGTCEVVLDAIPAGTKYGATVEALVEVGLLKNVIFLGRPADSRPDTSAILFVLEPGAKYAKRTRVHYGKMAGPLIQVLDGVSPGDLVIVTSMSKWAEYPRVRIE